MSSKFQTIRSAIGRLGLFGFVQLARKKLRRQRSYGAMVKRVGADGGVASLRERPLNGAIPVLTDAERSQLLTLADDLLADKNQCFCFTYSLHTRQRAWEFDPREERYWPRRHYTEQLLHAEDTPTDVKLVWEMNRFAHLPTLAMATAVTGDECYAREVEFRILSWIENNPFAGTINWASALELAIRLIAWTFTLQLLRECGHDFAADERIGRSVYQHLQYLAADLSTDKVVATNHLIGEAAGLFIGSRFWVYDSADADTTKARSILETEILRQTFRDGATREASSWYHQFVTHFFGMVDGVARHDNVQLSNECASRLVLMKSYLMSVSPFGSVVRYGDADDGWALMLPVRSDDWKQLIFGEDAAEVQAQSTFEVAQQATICVADSYLFVRGGEFGMGGAGYSSHAHDDLLSPILYLDSLPVIVDPGTYVYNGEAESRSRYRGADAHNGVNVAEGTGAKQRMNFGWYEIRGVASLRVGEVRDDVARVEGSYGDLKLKRRIELREQQALITDGIAEVRPTSANWNFHFDPRWRESSRETGRLLLVDDDANELVMKWSGPFTTIEIVSYDFSPAYRVTMPALAFRAIAPVSPHVFRFEFTLHRVSRERNA